MAFKRYVLENQIPITIYKRRASRNLKLSISSVGQVRVSIPLWAPYASGLKFAQSKAEWIRSQINTDDQLKDGQQIGKAHHLHFIHNQVIDNISSRVTGTEVRVYVPLGLENQDADIQSKAKSAAIKALRSQAEALLPIRLANLASKHQYEYASIKIKLLKSRWGSCDHKTNIVLNLYLMQLPWELIDYVILHELVHTKVMRHGTDFWAALESELPNARQLRKQIRSYQPVLNGSNNSAVA